MFRTGMSLLLLCTNGMAAVLKCNCEAFQPKKPHRNGIYVTGAEQRCSNLRHINPLQPLRRSQCGFPRSVVHPLTMLHKRPREAPCGAVYRGLSCSLLRHAGTRLNAATGLRARSRRGFTNVRARHL